MTTVNEETETVQWDDPCWKRVGISYRRVDYWTCLGYLHSDEARPGSGYQRRWPIGEVEIAVRIVRLVDAGLDLGKAAVAARASGPVEIGPGVWVGLADLEEAAP